MSRGWTPASNFVPVVAATVVESSLGRSPEANTASATARKAVH